MDIDDDEDYGTDIASDTTSLASKIHTGIFLNGRRYQGLNPDASYWGPSDAAQFESQATSHLVSLVHDKDEANPLFRSPLSKDVKYVLDIGTGEGSWAVDVADRFPNLKVYGVDLYPPPQSWVPENCVFEVDDVSKEWTWGWKWDLVHIRWMLGSFSREDWAKVYEQAYKNLAPGGYIEQAETGLVFHCDDGSIPEDSYMATWNPMLMKCGERAGRPLDTVDTMRKAIEEAGFTDIKEKVSKYPVGPWCKDPVLKEVGRLRLKESLDGAEGYATFLLSHFGEPEPWSAEKIKEGVEKMKADYQNKSMHPYTFVRRVWARKPLE